jgi:hypothetical protein
MSEFTQGVCADGAAILRDGEMLTPEQIITALNRAERIAISSNKKITDFNQVNAICWNAKGQGKTEIAINDVLDVVEEYCDS